MRRIISFLLVFFALAANARQVTSEEAQSIASEFFNSGSSSKVKRAPRRAVQASRSAENQSEPQPYYIFNADDNAGFVIISGDTRAKKIIGYSESGSFDTDNMPPQLKAMMERYSKAIDAIPASQSEDDSWNSNAKRSSNEGILLETANWGQGYPYNLMTPEINGEHCPAGCVATAMAIVMKYHNWPAHGKQQNSYSGFESLGADVFTNFEDFKFNYALMNDINNEKNQLEISKLIYACGRSVNMIYHPEGSGAQSSVIGYGLARYFGYSKNFQYLESGNFSPSEWKKLLKNEIDEGRPVIYTIPEKSHAVVCDGYRNDLIHINWGWDGIDNGFYDIASISSTECIMNINLKPDDFNEDIGSVFIDAGMTVPLANPFSSGIKTSVSKIEPNQPFDIFIETMNIDASNEANYSLGICVTDKNNVVKEMLGEYYYNVPNATSMENILNVTPYIVGWNGHFGIKARVSDLIIKSLIEEGDKLQLLTKNNNGDWTPMLGINCDSYMNLEQANVEISSLIINTNIPQEDIGLFDITQNNIFKGEPLSFSVNKSYDEKGCMNLHYLTIDGKNMHRMSGGSNQQWFYCQDFTATEDFHTIEIISIPRDQLISLNIRTEGTGNMQSYIEQAGIETELLNHLVVSGKVNNMDLQWMYQNLPALEFLDLSNAELTENGCFDNVYEYAPFLIVGQIGNLQTIKLPKNATNIPASTFAYFEPLENLYLPQSVKGIGVGAFQGANTLKHIVFESIEPCDLDPTAFNDDYYYNNITLHVPKGSVDVYRRHPEWGKFHNIIEGDVDAIDLWIGTVHYTGTSNDGMSVVGVAPDSKHSEDIIILDEISWNNTSIPVNNIDPSSFDSYSFKSVKLGKNILNLKNFSFKYGAIDYFDLGDYLECIGESSFCDLTVSSIYFGKSINKIGKNIFQFAPNPKEIYWSVENPEKLDLNSIIHSNVSVSIYSSLLEPTFDYGGDSKVFIPGKADCSYLNSEILDLTEMWQYEIDNDNHRVYIKPLIDGIEIENVFINGKDAICENYIYKLDNEVDVLALNGNSEIDVIVNYTLHGRQAMSTHYTPKFNSEVKRTQIDDLVAGIEDILCFEGTAIVKIYDIAGVLVFDGKYCDAKLDKGIYVIVSKDKRYKRLIK